MRFLVTRPALDAARLADALGAQGHNVVVSPVIEIYPTPTPLPAPAPIGALALTSANGARALAARLHDEDQRTLWQSRNAYAVGPQTAAALKALGWPQVHQADGTVEALADLIRASHAPDQGAILHIAGRHRAGDLARALAAQGLTCHMAMLYEAEAATQLSPAAQAALADADEPIDGVVLYSLRSADLYLTLSDGLAMARRPTAFCLSAPIAEKMQAAGYDTRIAKSPDEAGMLALTA